jgi:hypothetical protein
MSTQAVLFPGLALPPEKAKGQPKGYARPPGTGPQGETCASCAHCCYVRGGTKAYPKCGVIRHHWTHGPGTDIRMRSPACELWEGIQA